MDQKVFKFIAFLCSTVCLYVFIGFSSHLKSYENNFLYEYNKYSKQVYLMSTDSNDKCCPQTSADTSALTTPPPINQSLSSIQTNDKFGQNVSSGQFIHLNTTTEQLNSKEMNLKVSKTVDDYKKYCDIHIVMIFTITDTNNKQNSNQLIDKKLYRSLTSIVKHIRDERICVHLIGDAFSEIRAKSVIKLIEENYYKSNPDFNAFTNGLRFHFHNISKVNELINDLLPTLKKNFNYKQNSYYSHSLFFTSLAFHRYFTTIEKIIFLDIDVQFNDKVSELYKQFSRFSPEAVIGIAYEQQPVYRHILHEYRRKVDNSSRFGSPPPNGLPGFNSGVLLMDLRRMRESIVFNSLLDSQLIENMCQKYYFSGHLGDQDFYSVISFEFEHLFHVIPCNWNRQLCQWWRYHGYRDVFDSYFRCDDKIKLFHGNCNSVMPSIK